MPIYEFHCAACDQKVEIFRRSMAATGLFACPRCGSDRLERLLSQFAVKRSGSITASGGEDSYLDGLEGGDPAAMAQMMAGMGGAGGGMPGGFGGDDGFDDDLGF